MPKKLISCVSLPPATISSVPINEFAKVYKELANLAMEQYYSCCGKIICRGCDFSSWKSGNASKCPFCNANRDSKTEEERVQEMMMRVEANDEASIFVLATHYHFGRAGFQRDHIKAIELYTRAGQLGCGKAHCNLGKLYQEGGNMKKAKFHFEAAAMAGHEAARYKLGGLERQSRNIERAIKHWTIGASAGHYDAMHEMRFLFEQGIVSRELIDSTLAAYNNSCAEMRSEARNTCIRAITLAGGGRFQ
jgi:TPR repeat protein